MAERSPLFLGLARPPKYLGLPVGYLVVLATGVVLPFIWTKSMVFFLIGIGLADEEVRIARSVPHPNVAL